MKLTEMTELAQWAMQYALKTGADQSAVSISRPRTIEVEFRSGRIEKLKESTIRTLGISIYADQRYSSHSTSDLSKDSLKKFIAEAIRSTKYLDKDKFRSLPEPKYYPKKSDTDLKIYDSGYENITTAERVKIAAEIESAATAQSDRIISATSWYSDERFEKVLLHSNGFSGEHRAGSFSAGAMVTVRGDNNARPEAWFHAETRFRKDLPRPEQIGKEAAARALRRIGQAKIESGRYDMLVENRIAGRLISTLIKAMKGRALQQKSSYLEAMLDKKIASDKLTVIDDPTIEKGLGSRLFDGEGLTAHKRTVIEAGVLKSYYIDNYYGKKLGTEPTSGSVSNLVLDNGSLSLEEMVKSAKKAILVTGLLGGNFNSTTGDFSYGISGSLIENGERVKPVSAMNISGNAKQLWHSLAELGNDPYVYSSWRCPSMLFEKVSFSGI